jgi:DNA-binding NarL/FixJ family response regulator
MHISIIENKKTISDLFISYAAEDSRCTVVNLYSSFRLAYKKISDDKPDVILIGTDLDGISVTEAISKVKQILPQCYVFTLNQEEQANSIVFNAIEKGACGYVIVDTQNKNVINDIYEMIEGKGAKGLNIARIVLQYFQYNEQTPLTSREVEIMEMLARGKTRRIIAQEIYLDINTVKSHLQTIYKKLQVNSKDEALRIARTNRYILQ